MAAGSGASVDAAHPPPPDSGLASLGSGSQGNGTVVRLAGATLLIDCGFTPRQTALRLARLGLEPGMLDAILVTHEHSDHIAGVGPLARRHDLPVYLTQGTLEAAAARRALGDRAGLDLRPVSTARPLEIGGVAVAAVAVPHDAREPVQYLLCGAGRRVGVLTDLGHVPAEVAEHYAGCDALLLESNHDPAMLEQGGYPAHLKRRIGGRYGHLSNLQALALVESLAEAAPRLVIGHISERNNCRELLAGLFAPVAARLGRLEYASQAHGTGWIGLG